MIKVILYGLGETNREIAKAILEKKNIEIVGIVDKDPQKLKYFIDKILGVHKLKAKAGDKFSDISSLKADLVIHSTTPLLKDIYEQLEECLNAGYNVLTTSEEVSFPIGRNEDIIKKLDAIAKRKEVRLLGTGSNPGFVMDTLVILLTTMCRKMKSINVTRVEDLSKREECMKNRAGLGMNTGEFEENARKKIVGHIGLAESAAMIADALGIKPVKVESSIKPVLKERPKKKLAQFKQKDIIGFSQKAWITVEKVKLISLNLDIYWDAQPCQEIIIDGEPGINLKLTNIESRATTAAVVVNSIPKMFRGSHGYRTMKDVCLPCMVFNDFSKFVK